MMLVNEHTELCDRCQNGITVTKYRCAWDASEPGKPKPISLCPYCAVMVRHTDDDVKARDIAACFNELEKRLRMALGLPLPPTEEPPEDDDDV